MRILISAIIALYAFNASYPRELADSSNIIIRDGYPDRIMRPFPSKSGEQEITSIQLYRKGMQYYNGSRVIQNFTAAVNYFRLSAEKENPDAQYMLGICYKTGKGIKKDKKAAGYWFERSARQNNIAGIFELANCYYNGYGMKRNYKKAFEHYITAANGGLAEAQYMAGICYKKGKGVTRSYDEARIWFEKAIANGCNRAKKECESLPVSKLPH